MLSILTDKFNGEDDVPPDQVRKSLKKNETLRTTFSRAWPLLEPHELGGELRSVPAYLRACGRWLGPAEVRALQRPQPQAWTVSDLPILGAARQRLGDPSAAQTQRRRIAAGGAP